MWTPLEGKREQHGFMEWWKGLSLLSSHLTCQHEVEQVVREGGQPVRQQSLKKPTTR